MYIYIYIHKHAHTHRDTYVDTKSQCLCFVQFWDSPLEALRKQQETLQILQQQCKVRWAELFGYSRGFNDKRPTYGMTLLDFMGSNYLTNTKLGQFFPIQTQFWGWIPLFGKPSWTQNVFGLSFFLHDINGQFRGYATFLLKPWYLGSVFLGPAISPMYFPWVSAWGAEAGSLGSCQIPREPGELGAEDGFGPAILLGWWKCSGSWSARILDFVRLSWQIRPFGAWIGFKA